MSLSHSGNLKYRILHKPHYFFQIGKLHLNAHIPLQVETQIPRLSTMRKLCQGNLCHPFCTSKHVPAFLNALFREKQGTDTKNLISFMPDSCQGNNADVNPNNLEGKQNSSRTADWFIFGFMFSRFTNPAAVLYTRTALWPLCMRKKRKQITHIVDFKSCANISQAQNAMPG